MLRSEVITEIQNGLGFRSDKEDEIILALRQVQVEMEGAHTLPWFLLEEDQTLSITAGNPSVSLPTGFIRIPEEERIYLVDSSTNHVSYLERYDFDRAKEYFSTRTITESRGYALRKDSIYVFPTPTVDTTLYYSYYKKDDVLTVDIENQWLANVPYLFVGKAGGIVAKQLRDADAVGIFGQMEQKWFKWLMDEIAARDMSDRPMAVGESN
jgi:hypothetical protein